MYVRILQRFYYSRLFLNKILLFSQNSTIFLLHFFRIRNAERAPRDLYSIYPNLRSFATKAIIANGCDFYFRNAEALRILDSMLRKYDRRSTPTNNMGELKLKQSIGMVRSSQG